MIYLMLFIILIIWIFNPYPFIKFLSRIYGWNIQKGSRFAKRNIIGSRIAGIILLLFTIFVLLEDYGILKRSLCEILDEATKNVNFEMLAYMLSIIMGVIVALTGLIALVAPSRFRSFIWSKREKAGCLPIKQHFFQNIFSIGLRV
jgi:hypothetical protein